MTTSAFDSGYGVNSNQPSASVDLSPTTAVNLSNETGWTLTQLSPGSISIAAGEAMITIPSGSGATDSGGRGRINFPIASYVWQMTFRVRFTGDLNTEMIAVVGLTWQSNTNLMWLLRGDGVNCVICEDGGTVFGNAVAYYPVDGTTWFRLKMDGARVTCLFGIGVGSAAPTAWKLYWDNFYSNLNYRQLSTKPETLLVECRTNVGHVATQNSMIEILDLTLDDLTLGT